MSNIDLPAPPRGLRSFRHQNLEFHVYPTAVVMGRASAVSLARRQIELAGHQERVGFLMMAAPSGFGFYQAYAELAAGSAALQAALAKTHFFQFDDYPLPPEHPASFRHLLNEGLFGPLARWCPPENIHLLPAEAEDIEPVLSDYTREVLDHGPDLQLKGVGENGHWGFHEPGTPLDGEPAYIRVHLSPENTVQQLRDHPDVFREPGDVPREAFSAIWRSRISPVSCSANSLSSTVRSATSISAKWLRLTTTRAQNRAAPVMESPTSNTSQGRPVLKADVCWVGLVTNDQSRPPTSTFRETASA